MVQMWVVGRSGEYSVDFLLSFLVCVNTRDQTPAIRLVGRVFHPLGYITDPDLCLLTVALGLLSLLGKVWDPGGQSV